MAVLDGALDTALEDEPALYGFGRVSVSLPLEELGSRGVVSSFLSPSRGSTVSAGVCSCTGSGVGDRLSGSAVLRA